MKLHFFKKRNINGWCVYEKTLGSITATTHVNKTAINDNLKDVRKALMKKTESLKSVASYVDGPNIKQDSPLKSQAAISLAPPV